MSDLVKYFLGDGRVTRGTAQQWSASSNIIPTGALCVETDANPIRVKIGDGTKTYNQLQYHPIDTGNMVLKVASGTIRAGRVVAIIENTNRVNEVNVNRGNVNWWLGIARNSAEDGGVVQVDIFGGVSPTQNNLIVGSNYYVSSDGTLSVSSGAGPYVGRAVTSDSILIQGVGTMGNVPVPAAPVIVMPSNNETNVSTLPEIVITASFVNDIHYRSRFQISTDENFSVVVYDSGPITATLSHTVPGGGMLDGYGQYYVRAMVEGQGGWSLPSAVVAFETGSDYTNYEEWTTPGTYQFTIPENVNVGRITVIPDIELSSFGTLLTGMPVDDGSSQLGKWSELDVVIPGGDGIADTAVAMDSLNRIYVAGGHTGGLPKNTFYRINTATSDVTTLADLPRDISHAKAVVDLNGNVYLIGGIGISGESDEIRRKVYKYTPGTDTWSEVAPLSSGYYVDGVVDHGVVIVNDNIYLFGGYAGGNILTSVSRYSITNNTWTNDVGGGGGTNLADIPIPLHKHCTVLDSTGRIIIIGGETKVATTLVTVNNVYEYDIISNTMTTKTPMPTPRKDAVAYVDDQGYIYVIGGSAYSDAYPELVERYDSQLNNWDALVDGPTVHNYGAVAVSDNEGNGYVVGGHVSGTTNFTNKIFKYVPNVTYNKSRALKFSNVAYRTGFVNMVLMNSSTARIGTFVYACTYSLGDNNTYIMRYDIVNNVWSDAVYIRDSSSGVVISDNSRYLYVLGSSAIDLTQVHVYDTVTGNVSTNGNVPGDFISGSNQVIISDTITTATGISYVISNPKWSSSQYVAFYRFNNGTWTELPRLLLEADRVFRSSTKLAYDGNDTIYAVTTILHQGGGATPYSDVIYTYSISENMWTLFDKKDYPSSATQNATYYTSLSYMNGYLYRAGTTNYEELTVTIYTDDIRMFDLTSKTWTVVDTFRKARLGNYWNIDTEVYNGKIYIFKNHGYSAKYILAPEVFAPLSDIDYDWEVVPDVTVGGNVGTVLKSVLIGNNDIYTLFHNYSGAGSTLDLVKFNTDSKVISTITLPVTDGDQSGYASIISVNNELYFVCTNIPNKTYKFNGTDWVIVNETNTPFGIITALEYFDNYLYMTVFTNGAGYSYKYDIENNAWEEIGGTGGFGGTLFTATCIDTDGNIYSLGGFLGGNYLNSAQKWNVITGTKTSLANIRRPRAYAEAYVHDGKIYLVGGRDAVGNNVTITERYDPELDIWIDMVDMELNKWNFGLVKDNMDYVYALFGRTGVNSQSSTVQRIYAGSSVNSDIVFAGQDRVYTSSNGFNLRPFPPNGPGPYGITGKKAGVALAAPVVPGEEHTVIVGEGTGAVQFEWNTPVIGGPQGRVTFLNPGITEWRVPNNVNRIRISGIPGYAGMTSVGSMFAAMPPTGWAVDSLTLPDPVWKHASVTDSEGRIYVIGGINSSDITLNTVIRYDFDSETWETLAVLPQALSMSEVAYDGNDTIYVLGGMNSVGVHVANVYKYVISTDTWSSLASMPASGIAYFCAAMGSDGNIYAFGGVSWSYFVRKYTVSTNTWSNIGTSGLAPSSSGNGRHMKAIAVDNKIMIVGGEDGAGSSSYWQSALLFSIDGATWVQSDRSIVPAGVKGHAVANDTNGNVYLTGGVPSTSSTGTNRVFIYNKNSNSWAESNLSLSQGVLYHTSVLGKDRKLYVLGGAVKNANASAASFVQTSAPTGTFSDVDALFASENGWDFTTEEISSPGPEGTQSKIMGIKYANVTPGTLHTVNVGTPDGAVRIDWGAHVNESGYLAFTTPGAATFVPQLGITSVDVELIPGKDGLSSFGNVLTGLAPGGSIETPSAGTSSIGADLCGVVSVDTNKFHIFGGMDGSGVVKNGHILYDAGNGTITSRANMPVAKTSFAYTKDAAGRFYVIGGNNGSASVSSVHRYNPATNTWSSLANLPTIAGTSIYSALSAAYSSNGKIYALGAGSLFVYDISTDTWTHNYLNTNVPFSIPSGAGSTHNRIVIHDQYLYVMGGISGANVSNVVYKVSLTDYTVTVLSPMPTRRYGFVAMVDSNGYIYAMGGVSTDNYVDNQVDRYDIQNDVWDTVGSLLSPRYHYAGTVDDNGRLFIYGGRTTNGVFNNPGELISPSGTFSENDGITHSTNGWDITGETVVTNGPTGSQSKVKAIKRSIPVTYGQPVALTVGTPDGGIRVSWPGTPPPLIDNGPKLVSRQVFNFTGNDQTHAVPSGVSYMEINVYGANGGGSNGGIGAYVKSIHSVNVGEILTIKVGELGRNGYAGPTYPDGGGSGSPSSTFTGGGSSSVESNSGILTIAGAGGGGYRGYAGGNGGAPNGGDATIANSSYGKGATQYAGGQSGGMYRRGGYGFSTPDTVAGCGGGGGYYGGGAGSISNTEAPGGPGGGGSSYTSGVLVKMSVILSGGNDVRSLYEQYVTSDNYGEGLVVIDFFE